MKKQFLTLAVAGGVLMSGILTTEAVPCKVGEAQKAPIEAAKAETCNLPRNEMRQKPSPDEMKAMMEKRVEEFNKALNLSDEQIKKAKEIRVLGHNKMKPLIEKKRAKIAEIKAVMDNDNISVKEQDKKIDNLRGQLKLIDQDIRQLRQDNEKEFKAILNDEQKAKYQAIKEEGRKHYRNYHSPQGPEAFKNFGHHGPRGPHHRGFGPKPGPDATIQPVKPALETK